MEIYRNNTVIYTLRPEDNSTQRVVHMGEDVLNLTFRVPASIDLRVGDYVYFDDKKYTLKKPVNPKKISRIHFEYGCQFFSPQYDFQDALFMLSDLTGVGELTDTLPLFGTLTFHAQQIIRSVHEVHPDWELGDIEDFGTGKNIVYNEMDCLEAVQKLAEEFGCEYWFTDNRLYLGKRAEGEPLVFKYGKGNSLYDLSRTNQDGRIVTKLLISGSSRNIDAATYGSSVLRLPGGERYVYKNTDKYGVVMGRQSFPDVFPRLIYKNPGDPGSVTSARFANGIYYIKDENLNFNPGDYLLPGLSIKVVFQTGQMGGVKVDANWNNTTQEFELIRGNYGLGIDVPGSIFVPAEGDLYLLEDIRMPESYVTDAENELLQKANEAISQVSEQKVSYKGTLNYLYFKSLKDRVNVGRAVLVEDDDIVGPEQSIPLRVQALTRNVNDQYKVDVEISDTMYIGRLDKIETSIQEVKEEIVTTRPRNGDRGAAIVYRGIYEEIDEGERVFYNNRNRRDVVKYEDIYFIYRGADGAPNPVWIESSWEKFGDQFQAVATELLLAENANIAGWIFRNERLESQSGGAFLDGRTGEVSITGKFESNKSGKSVVVDPAKNAKIQMIDRDAGKVAADYGFIDPSGDGRVSGYIHLYYYDESGNIVANSMFESDQLHLIRGQNMIFMSVTPNFSIVQFPKLPTSSFNLGPGTLWNDNGTVKVV